MHSRGKSPQQSLPRRNRNSPKSASGLAAVRNGDGILPTLCYTKAVLKRITLDDLKELVDEILDGDITDVEYTTDDRLTDDDIRQYLRGHWQLEHPTDLQKKEKTDRNEILIEAIQYGAPLRQLSD